MIDVTSYNKDYYECGIEKGISGYSNYRWIPELTMPLAMTLIDYLNITRKDSILEIGCAKGYLVKSFRLLHRLAWGIDISEYAISQVDKKLVDYCKLWEPTEQLFSSIFPHYLFSICIAKDVFEHIEPTNLRCLLKLINSKKLFIVVPLGKNGKYVSPINDMDNTHIICEDKNWWINFLVSNGWEVQNFTYRINGIKDHYYTTHPEAHGFFTCKDIRNG